MEMIQKDYYYLWRHPEEYERLTVDQLNDGAVLDLMEMVLSETRKDIDSVVGQLKRNPRNKDVLMHAITLMHDLRTNFFANITFGRNEELAMEIENVIPKGVNRL